MRDQTAGESKTNAKFGCSEMESKINRGKVTGGNVKIDCGKRTGATRRMQDLEEEWKANQILRISSTHPKSRQHPIKPREGMHICIH